MTTSTVRKTTTADSFEIVLPRTAYDHAVRRQLHDSDVFAIGSFRWQETIAGRQLLVEQLDVMQGVPTGQSRPPLDCYCVLRVESSRTGWSADELLRRVTPLRSHWAAGLVVHVGSPARWDACVRSPDGATRSVDVVTIQGPAPLRLSREEPASAESLDSHESVDSVAWLDSADERQRWSRTVGALGEETFARVRRSRVDVIGAGRNGALCASMLASLGVAQLRLVDGDTLEPHNQVGTLGLDADDIGRSKAESLARSLHRQRPDLALGSWSQSLLDNGVQADLRCRPTDLLVTTVDDDAARLAAWLLARSLLIPHLDIATAVLAGTPDRRLLGDVRLLVPGRGQGCPVCVGGVGDLDETLYALNSPTGALRRGAPADWREQRAGSLVGLNALVVGAAMQLWLDYLSGRVRMSAWQRLRWQSAEGVRGEFAVVASDPKCRYCGGP